MTTLRLCALSAFLLHGAAFAGDSWQTSAELGAITTTGNTVGTTVTGKIDSRQEFDEWSNQYIVAGHFKEDEVTNKDGSKVAKRSAERFSLSARAGYKLMQEDEKLFVLLSHVDDKFGAYTSYSTMAFGHSTRWYRSPDASLDVEIGPGYFNGENANGEDENGFTVRGAALMKWRVSPSAHVTQSVSVERGTSNVHSMAETALSTKINGTMQMKAAFVARSDTNAPPTKKNTDTQTSLTLVYSF